MSMGAGEERVAISGMLGTAGLPFSRCTGEAFGEVLEDANDDEDDDDDDANNI